MISSGMLSACSAYTGKTASVYGSVQVSDVKNKQVSSDADNSLPKLSSNDDINDEAIISDEANALLEKEKSQADDQSQDVQPSKDNFAASETLSSEQQQIVAQLKARDTEVRAHEQAHIAAAAGLQTSAPSYDYQTGPDGQKYAVGGEVSISFASGGDPEEVIANAQTMKAAALAPAEPSSQDYAVAKNADMIIVEAREELAAQKDAEAEEASAKSEKSDKPDKLDKPDKAEGSEKIANETGLNLDKQLATIS